MPTVLNYVGSPCSATEPIPSTNHRQDVSFLAQMVVWGAECGESPNPFLKNHLSHLFTTQILYKYTGYPVSSLDIDLAEMDGETTCL